MIFFPLVCLAVLLSREFRQFERVTLRRVLAFFFGVFLGVTILIFCFSFFNQSFDLKTFNWVGHALWAAALTPVLTLKANFYLPQPSDAS